MNAITYKLFRVRVQAAQIKEKFGTLHFYTDVVCDPGPIVRGYEKFTQWIFDKIGMLKFNTQWKVDKEAYTETREEELTKEQYEEEVKRNKNSTWCAFVEKDGKWGVIDLGGRFFIPRDDLSVPVVPIIPCSYNKVKVLSNRKVDCDGYIIDVYDDLRYRTYDALFY